MLEVHPESLLGRWSRLPDPRHRRGRQYPLAVLLGMLLVGAMQGEGSLRGMWLRACEQWERIRKAWGLYWLGRPPALGTVWYALAKLEACGMEQQLLGEGEMGRAKARVVSVDGKSLRGSKRRGEQALQVVTAIGQALGQVLREQRVSQGDEVEATLALLAELPLEGKVVTLDAGVLRPKTVRLILKKRGITWGP